MIFRSSVIAAAFGGLIASVVTAAPIINVGAHTLLAGTPGQKVDLYASGGTSVDGVNVYVATGDGGSAVGGTDNAPKITNLVINGTGMLFAGRPQSTPDQTPQFYSASANTTSAVTIAPNTLLAELTIDTTGFTAGHSYPLALAFTDASGLPSTDFVLGGNEIAATIVNGTIALIPLPEPTSLATLAGIAIVTFRRRRP